MKVFFIFLINIYQKITFLFRKKDVCMFYPTCSEYTKQAIEKYGVFKGIYIGIKRILRCNPWAKNGIDIVP